MICDNCFKLMIYKIDGNFEDFKWKCINCGKWHFIRLYDICFDIGCSMTDTSCPGNPNCEILRKILKG